MKKTIVNLVLDKSGSMQPLTEATIKGVNEYLHTLQDDKKNEYQFTLTLFDTEVSQPIVNMPIRKVKDLTTEDYRPDGYTALYDAVCKTIKGVKRTKDQKVIFVIMTDGQENASKEYGMEAMRDLIKELEDTKQWTFVYLGANQDSYAMAQSYGIAVGNTSNFTASSAGVGATMRTMATNTVMYASASNSSDLNFFSKKDQEDLEKVQ